MRKIEKHPSIGDIRIKSWFALKPVEVWSPTQTETRQFERVTVRQQYDVRGEWVNLNFIDKMKGQP